MANLRASEHLERTVAERTAELSQRARELCESLDRQTATAEILKVIGNSVADTAPVFEKILDSCQSLFRADEVIVCMLRDQQLEVTAYRGPWEETVRRDGKPFPLEGSYSGLSIIQGEVVYRPSVASAPDMRMQCCGKRSGN